MLLTHHTTRRKNSILKYWPLDINRIINISYKINTRPLFVAKLRVLRETLSSVRPCILSIGFWVFVSHFRVYFCNLKYVLF